MPELYVLFGGTFDPIHYGHLRLIEALAQQISLQKITILLNNVPPHRPQPQASAKQRLEMLHCAIAHCPQFDIDARELMRETPSWTITTLEELRAERGVKQPIGFILGQDSLLTLAQWYRWQDLLTLCHLIVCQRPKYPIYMNTPKMQQWLNKHIGSDIQQLHRIPKGRVWLADTPLIDISAMEIRQRYYHRLSCAGLLPDAVIDYIDRAGLYRDLSYP